jgi:hypothetical protein
MISVVRITSSAFRVLGAPTDPEFVPMLRSAMEAAGAMVQKLVSRLYMTERHASLGRIRKLKANSRKWNAIKAKKGWSHLRGHQLNRIQNALMSRQLWAASAFVGGTAILQLDEMALRAAISHAEPYAKMKTMDGRILGVTDAWARRVQQLLRAAEGRYRAARERKHRAERVRLRTAEQAASREAAAARKAAREAERATAIADAQAKKAVVKDGMSAADQRRIARGHLKLLDEGGKVLINANGSEYITWAESDSARARAKKRKVTLARTAWRAASQASARLQLLGRV